jgi:hypothetical protein
VECYPECEVKNLRSEPAPAAGFCPFRPTTEGRLGDGGKADADCVFLYDPLTAILQLVSDSPGHSTLSGPNNLAVSPRGSLLICEETINLQREAQSLFALTLAITGPWQPGLV